MMDASSVECKIHNNVMVVVKVPSVRAVHRHRERARTRGQ